MSEKERQRLSILHQHLGGRLTAEEAAAELEMSVRQLYLIKARFLANGDIGRLHRARGIRRGDDRLDRADLFRLAALFVYFLDTSGDLSGIGIAQAFTDAFFEIMSGFTTTGSTILTDIEVVPRGLLFWRSLTHWLGGMGIVTLALSIVPAMGVSGYHMFKGEVPGPTTERMQPRLAQTASILWGVYALISLLEAMLLLLGGMDWFDALCHTFGTMATGGFSSKNLLVGHFQSDYIHWVITAFMFLAGVNFLLHYNVLRGNTRVLRNDAEFRFYVTVVLVGIVVGTGMLYFEGLPDAEYSRSHFRIAPMTEERFEEHVRAERKKVETLYGSFREAAFQVVSIVTTTGFGTADFDTWPSTLRLTLVVLMFFGGCAGSTGGGMKMIRVLVNIKAASREIVKMARPRIIRPIKIGGVRWRRRGLATSSRSSSCSCPSPYSPRSR